MNRALPALLALASLLGTPAAAREEAGTAGFWTVALSGSSRACRLMLSADAAPQGGRLVRYPAGCRRALPVLGEVATWRIEGGAVRLGGSDGAAILAFAAAADGALVARTEAGQEFRLLAHLPQDGRGEVPAISPGPSMPAALPAPRIPAPPAAAEEPVAGLYALDRFTERDTCRVQLVPGAGEGGTARVAEGCRDGGLAMFDPVSWRYEAGRLTLVARRGHEVGLVPIPGRRWRRDPETGTTFVLRRLEP